MQNLITLPYNDLTETKIKSTIIQKNMKYFDIHFRKKCTGSVGKNYKNADLKKSSKTYQMGIYELKISI